jgi:hypothetical protein
MPDCIIALVHSLQGNSVTYRVQPSKLVLALSIAFSYEWTTFAYLVFNIQPSLSQGNSSSLQPFRNPLYPY